MLEGAGGGAGGCPAVGEELKQKIYNELWVRRCAVPAINWDVRRFHHTVLGVCFFRLLKRAGLWISLRGRGGGGSDAQTGLLQELTRRPNTRKHIYRLAPSTTPHITSGSRSVNVCEKATEKTTTRARPSSYACPCWCSPPTSTPHERVASPPPPPAHTHIHIHPSISQTNRLVDANSVPA